MIPAIDPATGNLPPGVYDATLDEEGVDLFQLMRRAEELLEYRPERRGPRQKARYGGDFFALPPEGEVGREMLAVFQRDTVTRQPKGIIRIWLEAAP